MMTDFYRFKQLEKYYACIHAVTTKLVSEPYAFSLALHTGEDESSIIGNRKKISSLLGLDDNLYFVVANQTHSDHIEIITEEETKGWESLEGAVADCDALITNKKGIVLTILTADCVPVLMLDPQKEVVAAVHAGWKGTKAGIVSKTVKKMQERYGCDPKDIIAGIAPSIGRCCYEVGEDVAEGFFDIPKGFDKAGDKYMLDLPLLNKQQLLDIGIKEENIEMSGVCTACEVEKFFSYRKEQGCSGRFMSMIGLQEV
jgi:YfiH family protein